MCFALASCLQMCILNKMFYSGIINSPKISRVPLIIAKFVAI